MSANGTSSSRDELSRACIRFGMEEEYFVFDAKTRRAVRRANKKFLARAQEALGDRVMTEMLQSQIEVATPPCDTAGGARTPRTLSPHAGGSGSRARARPRRHGHLPARVLAGADVTRKARYGAIMDDLQMIGYRNMLCGMHVHVEVPDADTRINLIMRLTPYLPLLLALSTSSPFWQGHLTGLRGYRLAAYDELPRTGLPELFRTKDDYDEFVAALTWAKIIPDASYIWWAIRPVAEQSDHRTARRRQLHAARRCHRHRRACSAAWCARSIATARSMPASTASAAPSRWRTNGTRSVTASTATFVDPFSRSPLTLKQWLDQVLDFIAEDVDALGCARRNQASAPSSRARHQRRPPDRDLRQGQGRRPQKVNGAQGGHRLGGAETQAATARLKSEPFRASPYPPGNL